MKKNKKKEIEDEDNRKSFGSIDGFSDDHDGIERVRDNPDGTPAAASQPTATSAPVVQAATSVATAAATSAPTAAGKPKDTLVILSAESFTGSWDPTGSTVLANIHLEDLVFDRLWEIDWASGNTNYVPRLALSWGYLPDGVTLEVKLRPGVKFQDGLTLPQTMLPRALNAIAIFPRPWAFSGRSRSSPPWWIR